MSAAIFFSTAALLFVCLAAVPATAADAAPPVTTPALPDPLTMADGTRVTTARQWHDKRRPELLKLFADEVYGKTLVGRPKNLRFVVREEKRDARGGRATRLRVGVLFEGREDGRQMELLVYLPNNVKGPVPVFLGLNFDGNFTTTQETDLPVPKHWVNGLFYQLPSHQAAESQRGNNRAMWPLDEILAHGYGVATAAYGEVEADEPGRWKDGRAAWAPSGRGRLGRPRRLGVGAQPGDGLPGDQ